MRNYLFILAFCILFLGFGCGKDQAENFSVDLNADCQTAVYPFACFLDKATAVRDPNLCNDAGLKRITCLSAYEELLETEVACDSLHDQSFQLECSQYKADLAAQTAERSISTTTAPQIEPDSEYLNN